MVDVTVVVPTHNRPHWLRQTLRAVSLQRDVDLEVIVIDDGSRDPEAVADVVTELRDGRVRVRRNRQPVGVGSARNQGVASAGGAWVAFCDDDDLWAPDKLASQLRATMESGRRWSYVGAVNITTSGRVVGGAPPLPPVAVVATLPGRNTVPGGGSGVMAHRDLLACAGPFDGRLGNTEDWDLWVRLSRLSLPAWAPAPLLAYRVHAAGASLDTATIIGGAEEIERRYGGPLDRVTLYRHLARLSRRAGRPYEAVTWCLRAARLSRTYRHTHLRGDLVELSGARLAQFRARLGLPQHVPAPVDHAVMAYRDKAQAWISLVW